MITTILIDDLFVSKKECKNLIEIYSSNKNLAHKHKSSPHSYIYPLDLAKHRIPETDFIKNKLNEIARHKNAVIDYFQIVKWPTGSELPLHLDVAKDNTILTSILYLNNDYEEGETYLGEGTIIKPQVGRVIFFDGRYYRHGVKPIKKGTRFVIPAWYKKLDPSL